MTCGTNPCSCGIPRPSEKTALLLLEYETAPDVAELARRAGLTVRSCIQIAHKLGLRRTDAAKQAVRTARREAREYGVRS